MKNINSVFLTFKFLFIYFAKNVQTLQMESIVGGDLAEPNWFPYQVSVENLEFSICGGAIVGEWHVVTAAHCVIDEDNNFVDYPLKVVAGIVQLDSNPPTKVVRPVERIYTLKIYKRRANNGDLAVLKLKHPLPLDGKYLRALEIPDKRSYINELAVVTGFGSNYVKVRKNPINGRKEEGEKYTTGRLRYAKAIILSKADCQAQYKPLITDFHICAQVIQRDQNIPEGVCSGDSGSPLVYDNSQLIGILSASPKGCREKKAGAIYIKVSFYVNFINFAMSDTMDTTIRRSNILPS